MTWSDVQRPPTLRVLRQFGGLCLLVLGGLGGVEILVRARPLTGGVLLAAGVGCAVLSVAAPRVFLWVYTGAMVLVFPVGFAVSQVLLAAMFYGVFLVVGLALRMTGRDGLRVRRGPRGKTYWEDKPMPDDPRRYLRQY